MKYTDYNSLYLNAKKQMQGEQVKADDKPAQEVQSVSEEPKQTEPETNAEGSEPDHSAPLENKEPSETDAEPATEPQEPVTEPPQDTAQTEPVFVSGIGNNSDDLKSFSQEFTENNNDAVFVEPGEVIEQTMPPEETKPVIQETETKPAYTPKKQAPVRSLSSSPRKKSDDDYEKSHLRSVPAVLVRRARQLFPAATNQDDAVAAYIYLKEGCPVDMDVPEYVKDVAESYVGETLSNEDIQSDFMDEMNKLKSYNKQLMQKINAIEMAAAYIIFDRTGYRKADTGAGVDHINFTEAGMHELMDNLEVSSFNYQTRVRKSEGRTKR